MKLLSHIRAALESVASKSWHGKGCKKTNCGTVCLCGPCHARIALARLRAGEKP